jgi:hypothetical protein
MYPKVAGEVDTIRKICKGFSIARFGDGEVKMIEKHVYTRELIPVPALSAELRQVIEQPHEKCLIGIPTMDPKGTKYQNWQRHIPRFCKYFREGDGRSYYSALITRPDCGVWMESREYYEQVIRIWADKKRIAIVSEASSKLLSCVRETHEVVHIECPMYGAYACIDSLEKQVVEAKPDLALLSVGPTATCLANRLSKRGLQAVDLGSIGGFLLRWKSGAPKPKNYEQERINGN